MIKSLRSDTKTNLKKLAENLGWLEPPWALLNPPMIIQDHGEDQASWATERKPALTHVLFEIKPCSTRFYFNLFACVIMKISTCIVKVTIKSNIDQRLFVRKVSIIDQVRSNKLFANIRSNWPTDHIPDRHLLSLRIKGQQLHGVIQCLTIFWRLHFFNSHVDGVDWNELGIWLDFGHLDFLYI